MSIQETIVDYLQDNMGDMEGSECRKNTFGKANMFFFDNDEMSVVYADSECEKLSPNPTQADADGNFPDVYMGNDSVVSSILVQDNKGQEVFNENLESTIDQPDEPTEEVMISEEIVSE